MGVAGGEGCGLYLVCVLSFEVVGVSCGSRIIPIDVTGRGVWYWGGG